MALASQLAAMEKAADEAGAAFMTTLRRHGIPGEWETVEGAAEPSLSRRARSADLLVLGQRDPDQMTNVVNPEEVILGSGRPVLVVPYIRRIEQLGTRMLVAWNGSREAARAVHDALPLMAVADV
jgi:nucleotide-binding universal stress UspA family protein